LSGFVSCRNTFDTDRIANLHRAALPAVALELDGVADIDRPIRHRARGIAHIDEQESRRRSPFNARHHALQPQLPA